MTLDPAPAPSPAPGLFNGAVTRERSLFGIACAGSFLFLPLVAIASLLWWPAAARFPGQTAYRRKWLVASLLFVLFDLLLAAVLGIRAQLDDSFYLPGSPGVFTGGEVILGVSCRESDGRVAVEQVLPETAAADAGIEAGDQIVALAGKPIRSSAALQKLVAVNGRNELEITVLRDGQERSFTARPRGEPQYLVDQRAGFAALRRGDLAGARDEFERTLAGRRSTPAASPALRGLAWVHLREGDLDSTASLLEEALSVSAPSGRDSLRSLLVGVALKRGRPADADRWYREIEDGEIRGTLTPAVLVLRGGNGEAWGRWLIHLASGGRLWIPWGALAVLALVAGLRRPLGEGVRFFLLSGGVLLGGALFGILLAAAHGALAEGNPFAFSFPALFPAQAILTQLGPLALLALSIAAARALPLEGGLPVGPGRNGLRGLAAGVLAGLFLLMGFALRARLLIWAAGYPDAESHPLEELAGQDLRLIWWLLPIVCLLGPIAEEYYFRGLLQGHLRSRLGPVWAIVCTGLFFGLLHPVSLSYAAAAAALGFVFGYLRERSGTLAAPILAHSLWNTVAWATAYFR